MAVYALGEVVPEIHPDAFVHPDATVVGAVEVGAEASVWPQAVLRGDYGRITVGPRTSIQDGAVIHATERLSTRIGADCVVGHLAHMECCEVHDAALVGSGAIVLHEAVVETRALVGAAALVPNGMVVPTGAMALGVPARLRPDTVTDEMIRSLVERYLGNARRYRAELRRLDGR